MSTVFVEVIVNANDAAGVGILSRDEIEDTIKEALDRTGYGEVTGGGGGSGIYSLDVELPDRQFEDALQYLKDVLRKLQVPQTTRMVRHRPSRVVFDVYD